MPPIGGIGVQAADPCVCGWIYGLKPLDIVDDRSTQLCGCDRGANYKCARHRDAE